jgi:hypothetical protein
MCYNWTVDGDGGGISNHRLDILIENPLMLAGKSKKYFTFVLVLGGTCFGTSFHVEVQ